MHPPLFQTPFLFYNFKIAILTSNEEHNNSALELLKHTETLSQKIISDNTSYAFSSIGKAWNSGTVLFGIGNTKQSQDINEQENNEQRKNQRAGNTPPQSSTPFQIIGNHGKGSSGSAVLKRRQGKEEEGPHRRSTWARRGARS